MAKGNFEDELRRQQTRMASGGVSFGSVGFRYTPTSVQVLCGSVYPKAQATICQCPPGHAGPFHLAKLPDGVVLAWTMDEPEVDPDVGDPKAKLIVDLEPHG